VAPDYKTFRELTVDDPGFVDRWNLGAYYKGKLVGITLLRARNGQGEVFYTGVVARHRARGLATVLKARSIFAARRQGITSAYTDVNSGNTPVIRANEKLGMKRAMGRGQWVMRDRRTASLTRRRPDAMPSCLRHLKSAFLREQLGNSRARSGSVAGCRFVFAEEKRTHSDRTRLTVRPRPTAHLEYEKSPTTVIRHDSLSVCATGVAGRRSSVHVL